MAHGPVKLVLFAALSMIAWSDTVEVDDVVQTLPSPAQKSDVVADGTGGAFVAWLEGLNEIRAQHLDASGARLWGIGGVLVTDIEGNKAEISVQPDGAGGCFVVWTDTRPMQSKVHAQRLDAAGSPLWQEDGVPVDSTTNTIYSRYGVAVADGTGGLYVSYEISPIGGITLVAVQHFDAAGARLWSDETVMIGNLGEAR